MSDLPKTNDDESDFSIWKVNKSKGPLPPGPNFNVTNKVNKSKSQQKPPEQFTSPKTTTRKSIQTTQSKNKT